MKNTLIIAFLVATIGVPIYTKAQNIADTQPQQTTYANDITANDVLSATSVSWIEHYGDALLVYPNPAINNTRIVLAAPAANKVYVDLVNLNGSVVRSYQYGPGSYQLDLDLGNVPPGMYHARISSNRSSPQSVKLLKQ